MEGHLSDWNYGDQSYTAGIGAGSFVVYEINNMDVNAGGTISKLVNNTNIGEFVGSERGCLRL